MDPRPGFKLLKLIGLGALVLIGTLTSCASNPPRPVTVGYGEGFLPSGGEVVGQIRLEKVPRLRSVLEKHPSLRDIAGRIQRLWFTLDIEKYHPKDWHLVLDGDFPQGAVGWVLDNNKAWVRQNEGVTQWRNDSLGLHITLPEERIVLASNTAFAPADTRWKTDVPGRFPGRLMESGDFTLVLDSPVEGFLGKAAAKMLRVKEVWVVLSPAGDLMSGSLVLKMDDERSAKAGTVIMRLLKGGMGALVEEARREGKEPSPLLELLKNVEWNQEGTDVRGTGFAVNYGLLESFLDKMIPEKF